MEAGQIMDVFAGITDGLEHLLGWSGQVVTSLLTTGGDLNPLASLFFISIAGSACFFGVKLLKGFIWGA